MNTTTLKGNWNELKGKIRERWSKLTGNDVEQIQGRSEQLLGRVQRAYGLSKEEAQRQIEAFEADCGCGTGDRNQEQATRESAGAGLSPDEIEEKPRYDSPRTSRNREEEAE